MMTGTEIAMLSGALGTLTTGLVAVWGSHRDRRKAEREQAIQEAAERQSLWTRQDELSARLDDAHIAMAEQRERWARKESSLERKILSLEHTAAQAKVAAERWELELKRQSELNMRLDADLEKALSNAAMAQTDAAAARAELADSCKRLAQLEQEQADLRATNEQLQGELAAQSEHVAALTEQLEALGATPAPRPAQPRDAAGRFTKAQ